MNARSTRGFTLVELLVVIAIIGTLVALLLPAVQAARDAARRMQCSGNMHQWALAMQNYHTQQRILPPGALSNWGTVVTARGGDQLWYHDHSWFTQMGPYIDQLPWYQMMNFSLLFSDSSNAFARSTQIPIASCPSDGPKRVQWKSIPPAVAAANWNRWRGNYVVNWGNTNYAQGTLGPFSAATMPATPPWYYGMGNSAIATGPPTTIPFFGAPFGFGSSARLDDITDGTSNTLMMSECIALGDQLAQHGAVAATATNDYGPMGDISFSTGGQTFNGSLPPNWSQGDVVYSSSTIWPIPTRATWGTSQATMLNGVPVSGPIVNGDVTTWSPYTAAAVQSAQFAARSKHGGGVNVTMCDGSGRFVSDAVDAGVWIALSSSKGGPIWNTTAAGNVNGLAPGTMPVNAMVPREQPTLVLP